MLFQFWFQFLHNGKPLIGNRLTQKADIFFFGYLLSIADEEYIAIKIELDSPNTTDEITEFHACHLRSATTIVRNEKIIRRQINTLYQSAGAEHCGDFAFFEELLYSLAN